MFGKTRLNVPKFATATLAFCLLFFLFAPALAQRVSVNVSSKEAYVGAPIVLQIQISNADDFALPKEIEIDGCDVRSAGAPAQSSQVTIFNGRRSEIRTVTQQYLVTPRSEGRFKVPELRITVNGEQRRSRPIEFVATKSETGDLLFAEIAGEKDKVYVGEPLDLTLKIWIKPFSDRKNEIKLSEGNMWQMISDSTSWGPFKERIEQFAKQRQRPGGESVLRNNGQGGESEYFLYQIDATVYPTKPGKIDGDDVQVVVNYPLELGRSRDPFGSIFESRSSGSSLMRRMMEDDFFSGSSFGRRLTVTRTRPIVASAAVDATEVVPVPIVRKPDTYRGAVGQYSILTEAEPTVVDAGDPITLRIGIIGDGPMDLVQAPPLAQVDSLTDGFKVTDQSLAGFVQDDTKVFVTTIRPRNDAVTEIPPIPFSFFDPNKESYQTVYSKRIPINVNEAETLAMDSIVSNLARNNVTTANSSGGNDDSLPDLRNDYSANVLLSQGSVSRSDWRLWFVYPFFVWLAIAAFKVAKVTAASFFYLRSSRDQAVARINGAVCPREVQEALIYLVGKLSKNIVESPQQAVGILRTKGHAAEANELELLFEELEKLTPFYDKSQFGEAASVGLSQLQSKAVGMANAIETSFAKSNTDWVRQSKFRSHRRMKQTVASIIAFALFALTSIAHAQIESSLPLKDEAASEQKGNEFSNEQLKSVLNGANKSFQQGEELMGSDAAEAVAYFEMAAKGYQALIDLGKNNEMLFINLANSYWRSNDLPRAIANYHRALTCNPNSDIAKKNLSMAETQLANTNRNDSGLDSTSRVRWIARTVDFCGRNSFVALFALSSIVFWAAASLRILGLKVPFWQFAVVSLTGVLIFGSALFFSEQRETAFAISVVNELQLRGGDGNEFDVDSKIELAEGIKLKILDSRNDWLKVATFWGSKNQARGWIQASKVEVVGPIR